MQVTVSSSEGLRREFQIVVPAADIEKKMTARLVELGHQVKLPGFRPGKVPLPLLKQRYGRSVMGEVLEAAVNEGTSQAMTDQGLRPAGQPKIEITKFDEGVDLEYTLAVEVLPEITPVDFATIELVKETAEAGEQEVEDGLKRIAESQKTYKAVEKPRKAADGDQVLIDFAGTCEGVAREDMKAEDFELVLGSGFFMPGFEDQLVGAKPGEERTVTITIPETVPNPEIAGKEAVFAVTVKEVREPVETTLDDDFAKTLGFDDIAAVRKAVRERIEQEFGQLSRVKAKRRLLDKLAEAHDFEVPEGLVDAEFEVIWKQLQDALERAGEDDPDKQKSEDELRAEYRTIAERRVRLGLLLSHVGETNNIQITQEELNRAVFQEARRFPGQEQQVFEFFRKNPQALNNLRAPILEDKVVDFILEIAKVETKIVTPEELGRDLDEDGEAKPAAKKKAAAKKAAPKKAEDKDAGNEADAGDDAAAKKPAAKKATKKAAEDK